VFANAFGMPGDMWNYQRSDIAEAGFRCITYDRRGHARSDRPARGYDLDSLADDLASLMEALDVEQAVLVGHSMGAAEAIRYLTRHGTGKVAALVLSAPTAPLVLKTADNPDGIDRSTFEAGWELLRHDAGVWLVASTTSGPNYWGVDHGVSPLVSDWTMKQLMDTPPSILVETAKAFAFADFRTVLPELRLPTLVIQGNADGGATPLELTGRKAAALIPDSKLVVLEGGGHGIYVSQAARYNAELLEFFKELK
jgi:pimeloyl-ACP methyl ester carboxylesterase